MTLMADEGGMKELKGNPLTEVEFARIAVPAKSRYSKETFVYKRSNTASIKVEDDCCCFMGNWNVTQDPSKHAVNDNVRYRGMSFA